MASESGPASGRGPTVRLVPRRPAMEHSASGSPAKPTVAALGVDLAALDWQRSGTGPGSFEVAFVAEVEGQQETDGPPSTKSRGSGSADGPPAEWVLLRVSGDPAGRVLVYDRNEWLCFVDGARHGEFDC